MNISVHVHIKPFDQCCQKIIVISYQSFVFTPQIVFNLLQVYLGCSKPLLDFSSTNNFLCIFIAFGWFYRYEGKFPTIRKVYSIQRCKLEFAVGFVFTFPSFSLILQINGIINVHLFVTTAASIKLLYITWTQKLQFFFFT